MNTYRIVFAALLTMAACSTPTSTVMIVDVEGLDIQPAVDADAASGGDLLLDGGGDTTSCQSDSPCIIENEFGTCAGQWLCDGKNGPVCSAETPEEESCDGLDNDCDGTIDDIPCDDLDKCTDADVCLNGTCSGTATLCDDDNSCTDDSCDSTEGCLYAPLSAVQCDDGDVCTADDYCEDGLCIGIDVACHDQDPCTMDFCNSATGCVFEPTDSVCDDDDPCTLGDICVQGVCQGTPVSCDCLDDSDCLALEDGDICNGTLVCDLEEFPSKCAVAPATVVDCPEPTGPDAACLNALCDPETGSCTLVAANENKACDDDDACTIADSCEAGECFSSVPINCNDGNPCTDDLCDPVTGCLHVNNSVSCNDDDACTAQDSCVDGLCSGSAQTICDDLNPCTDDLCDPQAGCLFTANTKACDDANACTMDEVCSAGACKNGKPIDCEDGNLCTTDSCSPTDGCVHAANSVPCNDGDSCTTGDHCSEGTCQSGEAANCDDGNSCTNDLCDPDEGCLHTDNQLPCDDNNSCTTEDACDAGNCVGIGSLDCDDSNACTKDICLPLGGCQHENVNGPCSDSDDCTVNDFCQAGSCISGAPLACDDNNDCTDDVCEAGLCEHAPAVASCDDQNLCTLDDTCTDGQCQGGEILDCDDGNVCTTDSCNPALGCTHNANGNLCDDGDACTIGDACADSACNGLGILNCDDGNPCTDDSCAADMGCLHAFNELPCSDGNSCTAADICIAGICIGTKFVSCDDDNPCTDDSCSPLVGCSHDNNESSCEDGDLCSTGDLCQAGACLAGTPLTCNDENVCTDDSCEPDAGCVYLPNDVPCSDDNACTANDTCAAAACVGGPPPDCDDLNSCTNDGCDWQTGCYHLNNAEPCDDGSVCTQTDQCNGGSCVGGNPLICDDANDCTADTCEAEAGCIHEALVPCCGDGSIDGDEVCDDGGQNGAVGLGTCSETCQLNGRYELVLRMATSGQVLDGTWDEALDRVVTQAQDCIVRADSRVAKVKHIEYDFNLLRFDFQPLHAYHNSWDTYAYIELRNNIRAGLGVTYRRGHASYVWKKDHSQNGEAAWVPAEVYLYCERETRFARVSSFAADGTVVAGISIDKLISLVSEDGAECKVRYDSRISNADHIEYGENLLYFDFLPLHASYNTWDAYAYVTVDSSRAALAAAYRRGHADNVYMLDRQQHAQASAFNLPVDVFCRTWDPTIVKSDGAAFTQGDFAAAYEAVVTDGRDCRIGFNNRVAEPQYVEFSNGLLAFEFENLHAPYDSWEAFARITIASDGKAELQSKYRRGNQTVIDKKSDEQSAPVYKKAMPVTLFCDSKNAPAPALTMNSGGTAVAGSWSNFHSEQTNFSTAYDCKVRTDGRLFQPQLTELATVDEPVYFDMVGLAAFNGSWDAYAGILLENDVQSSIYSSLRRGHASYVWQKGRAQYQVYQSTKTTSEFLCE